GQLLRFLAGERDGGGFEGELRNRGGGECERNTERRARRQSRADRHGRRDLGVEADRRAAAPGEHREHRGDRPTPGWIDGGGYRGAVGREVDRPRERGG